MASITRSEFISELKLRSKLINALSDALIDDMLDEALEAYSEKQPNVLISEDNAVPTTTPAEIDLPANALKILKIRDSDTQKQISFNVRNDGTAKKIRLGSFQTTTPEKDGLLTQTYYVDTSLLSDASDSTGYSNVDIEYTLLHTIATISDLGLRALRFYMEWQVYENKIEDVENRIDITDQEPSGASTTIKLSQSIAVFSKLAESKMKQFEKEAGIAYGTRG